MNIKKAIEKKLIVNFDYHDKLRIGQPRVLGITNDTKQLLVWQTDGESDEYIPGWRRFNVSEIKNFEVTDEHFKVTDATGEASPFDEIEAVVTQDDN